MKLPVAALLAATLAASLAFALPAPQDRVYTADQNSNTVSVINPASNELLGQIRLGNPRPDVLSPLYKGEINVHGLGFSPDHRTLVVISTGSNAVTFIDTASNRVKGTAYVGRSPHEGFFTPDGHEVWVTVRGEAHLAVVDPVTYTETGRIPVTAGPGMVLFRPDGRYAFVCNSFNPVLEVVDVRQKKVVKKLTVASPFSPFLQFTPDFKEVWLTHKDVGKVTRVDAESLEVKGDFDTGLITNHLAFARTPRGTFAYVTVGGENRVKVYTVGDRPRRVADIPVGALPHGIWAADDGSRVYVGLENGDAVEAIDTAENRVVAHVPVGQAPQALVYVSHAVPGGDGRANLTPGASPPPISVVLRAGGEARGQAVVRNLGLVDQFEVNLWGLKPETVYSVYVEGNPAPVGIFKSNAKGAVAGSAVGPLRRIVTTGSGEQVKASRVLVMEGETPPAGQAAVMSSTE